MSNTARLAVIACVCAVLAGCGADDAANPPQPATSRTTSVDVATTVDPRPPSAPPATSTPVWDTAEPSTQVPAPASEPPVSDTEAYIVDCQTGLGPIETYWSDGTVTGYTDYCQSVHDRVLEGERAANAPVCDGIVCRYPSGEIAPDPNAVPDDRCTNQINYAGDPRSNAEINSIGEQTGQCPAPIS